MKRLYLHNSPAGTFYICLTSEIYFTLLENNLLNYCPSAEKAARELAESPVLSLPAGISFYALALPADLSGWRKV